MDHRLVDRPVILIDQKKSRIRIYGKTLNMLGNPSFIQLLVHPENMTVAIRPAAKTDGQVHRVFRKTPAFELYSSLLIQKLRRLCTDWSDDESYRLSGEMILSETIVLFDLRRAVPLSSMQEVNHGLHV